MKDPRGRYLSEFLNDAPGLHSCISKYLQGENGYPTILIDGHSGVGKTAQTVAVLAHATEENTNVFAEYTKQTGVDSKTFKFYALSMCNAMVVKDEENPQTVYKNIKTCFKESYRDLVDFYEYSGNDVEGKPTTKRFFNEGLDKIKDSVDLDSIFYVPLKLDKKTYDEFRNIDVCLYGDKNIVVTNLFCTSEGYKWNRNDKVNTFKVDGVKIVVCFLKMEFLQNIQPKELFLKEEVYTRKFSIPTFNTSFEEHLKLLREKGAKENMLQWTGKQCELKFKKVLVMDEAFPLRETESQVVDRIRFLRTVCSENNIIFIVSGTNSGASLALKPKKLRRDGSSSDGPRTKEFNFFEVIVLTGSECITETMKESSILGADQSLCEEWKSLVPRLRMKCPEKCDFKNFIEYSKLFVEQKLDHIFTTLDKDLQKGLELEKRSMLFEFFSCLRVNVMTQIADGPGKREMHQDLVSKSFFIPCVYSFKDKRVITSSHDNCFEIIKKRENTFECKLVHYVEKRDGSKKLIKKEEDISREQIAKLLRIHCVMHTIDTAFMNCIAFTIGFMAYTTVKDMQECLGENPQLTFRIGPIDGHIGESVASAAVFYASNYKLRMLATPVSLDSETGFAKAGIRERIDILLNKKPCDSVSVSGPGYYDYEPMVCFPCAATFTTTINDKLIAFKKWAAPDLDNVSLGVIQLGSYDNSKTPFDLYTLRYVDRKLICDSVFEVKSRSTVSDAVTDTNIDDKLINSNFGGIDKDNVCVMMFHDKATKKLNLKSIIVFHQFMIFLTMILIVQRLRLTTPCLNLS